MVQDGQVEGPLGGIEGAEVARTEPFLGEEASEDIDRMVGAARAQFGLDAGQQELILEAAPMHDVGKLGTPDLILLKPGKLTPEEFAVMKQHATIGWEILRDSAAPSLRVAAEIAYTHHEKFDGSGYPRSLQGEDIPLFGRIVAIADVFDALTSARPYKPAWSNDDAFAMLRQLSGRKLDEHCVSALIDNREIIEAIKGRPAGSGGVYRFRE